MAYYKYIVVKINGNEAPVLFDPLIKHKDVFDALNNFNLIDKEESPVSAGQVSIFGLDEFDVSACGGSASLGILNSRSEDAKLIKNGLNMYL